MTTTRVDKVAVAYQPKPSTYFNGRTRIRVQAGVAEVYALPAIPATAFGKRCTAATLTAVADTKEGSWAGTRNLTVALAARVNGGQFSTIKWGNKPGPLAGAGVPAAVTVSSTGSAAVQWNIKPLIDHALAAGPAAWNGLVLTTNQATKLYIKGYSEGGLTLNLEWSDTLPAPSGLSPAGGVTALAKPVLRFQVPAGATQVRAQVGTANPDGSWTTSWDSNPITAPAGALAEISTAAWAGAAAGATTTWRAGIYDPTAAAWVWSTPVSWTRAAGPTVAFTSPTGPTGNPTPVYQWTVTGGTQVAFELDEYDTATGTIIHDGARTPGTSNSVESPVGASRNGQAITARVRVWDRPDRLDLPEARAYTEATTTWSLNWAGAGEAPDLHIEQAAAWSPVMRATITRTLIPDGGFVLVRDDHINPPVVVAQWALDEHVVAAGVWEIEDWACPPNSPVEYSLVAIDDNVATTPRIWTGQSHVRGLWVLDEPTGTQLQLAGRDDLDLAVQASDSIHVGQDGTTTRRHHHTRGRDGTLTGVISDALGDVTTGRAAWRQITEAAKVRRIRVTGITLTAAGWLLAPTDLGDVDAISTTGINQRVAAQLIDGRP